MVDHPNTPLSSLAVYIFTIVTGNRDHDNRDDGLPIMECVTVDAFDNVYENNNYGQAFQMVRPGPLCR